MILAKTINCSVFCALVSVVLLLIAATAGAAPTLTISTLPDGAVTNNRTLNVSGAATNGAGVTSVTINGESATLQADDSFSHALTLSAGTNNVTTVATDATGNSVQETRIVTLDPSTPQITLTSPPDNSVTSQSPLTLTGTVTNNAPVYFSLNGAPPEAAAMSGSSFTADVHLAAGLNTITLTATDQAANKSSAVKRTLVYDTTKPTLQINDPSEDIVTDQSSYLVKGAVSDTQSTVTVAIDGVTSTPPVSSGLFEQLVNFSENKSYRITATATDAAGKETAVTRNIIYNTASPAMTAASSAAATGTDGAGRSKKVAFAASAIVLPEITGARSTTAGGYYKAGSQINVTLDFSEPVITNGLTILLNSGATISSGAFAGISYSGMYVVADGENVDILNVSSVSGTLADAAGNQNPNPSVPDGSNIGNIYKITVDTAPPTATISSRPADPTKSKTGSFSFNINETGTMECRIDSGAYSSCTSPRNVDLSTLADTRHTFFVRGIDQAGNIGAPTSYSWTIDTTPPSVNAGGNKAANAIFTQTATVSDANPLGLTYQWTPQSGPGTITFGSLTSRVTTIKASADGTYLLRLTVTDAAGNSAYDQMTLTWDTKPPSSVNAGGDKTANTLFTQTGSASSDATAFQWTKQSGPGGPETIKFGSPTSLVTAISATVDGTYVLRLTASDAAGNSAYSEMTLVWDTTPPTVDAGGNKTANALFTQKATSNDTAATYQWTKQSGPGTISFGSPTALETTISASADGSYVLRLTATDAIGNSAYSDLTLVWDTSAPLLDVTSPAGDVRTTQNSIVINGTTSDSPTGVKVTITIDPDTRPPTDQVPYTPQVVNGSFSQTMPLSGENIYTIAVKATDVAGNESIVKRRVILGIPTGDLISPEGVDLADALLALQVSVGLKTMEDSYLVKGDIGPLKDGVPAPDWKIDISDAVLILRIIVGDLKI